jgi:hypothetical protein
MWDRCSLACITIMFWRPQRSDRKDTPLVDLDDQGDARFGGSVGPMQSVCGSEPDIAFLIRTGGGRWIAGLRVA